MRRLNFSANLLNMMQAPGSRSVVTYSSAFLILMGLLLTGFVLGGGVAIALWPILTGQPSSSLTKGITDPSFVNAIRITQMASTFFIFFIPALITARIMDRRPLHWLGYNRLADGRVILSAMALMALCVPVVGLLSELNEMIPVPASLEAVFKTMEDAYQRQAKVMTQMKGWGDYVFSLLVMALAPAIFEETFFRGGLQRILHGMTGRTWSPIIISGLIFSAIHFSYFGFIPRFALGVVLGLLYQYSGSLWTSIAAHFLNNAVVVTIVFVYTMRGLSPEQAMEADAPLWMSIPAIGIVIFGFIKYKSIAGRARKERMDPEEKAWEEKWLA